MGIEIKMTLGTPSEQDVLMELIDAPEWVTDEDDKQDFWDWEYAC